MPNRPVPRLAYPPPSAIVRALLSLVLLLGFYIAILGVAAILFFVGIVVIIGTLKTRSIGLQGLIASVFFLIPAALLVMSLFGTRRSTFTPPGRRLDRAEA